MSYVSKDEYIAQVGPAFDLGVADAQAKSTKANPDGAYAAGYDGYNIPEIRQATIDAASKGWDDALAKAPKEAPAISSLPSFATGTVVGDIVSTYNQAYDYASEAMSGGTSSSTWKWIAGAGITLLAGVGIYWSIKKHQSESAGKPAYANPISQIPEVSSPAFVYRGEPYRHGAIETHWSKSPESAWKTEMLDSKHGPFVYLGDRKIEGRIVTVWEAKGIGVPVAQFESKKARVQMQQSPAYANPTRRGVSAFLQTKDDMQWLRDVHLKDLPAKYKSAVLYGNEDSPELIEVYEKRSPNVDDPHVDYEPDEERNYHVVSRSNPGRRA